MPLAKDVDLGVLAERSDRFTGADLEDLTRRAGLAALKRSMSSETVTMEDFETALKDTRASVTEAMERDYEKIQGEIKPAAMSVDPIRSDEHTSELQSLMRISYAVFCLINIKQAHAT